VNIASAIQKQLARWPIWLRSVVTGIFIVLIIGPGFGIVVLPIMGLIEHRSDRFIEAAILLVVSFTTGSLCGLTHYFTRQIQQLGYFGSCLSWIAIIEVYLFSILLFIVAIPPVDPRNPNPTLKVSPEAFVGIVAIAGLFVGGTFGIAATIDERRERRRFTSTSIVRREQNEAE
jgi:hypothetical protein